MSIDTVLGPFTIIQADEGPLFFFQFSDSDAFYIVFTY